MVRCHFTSSPPFDHLKLSLEWWNLTSGPTRSAIASGSGEVLPDAYSQYIGWWSFMLDRRRQRGAFLVCPLSRSHPASDFSIFRLRSTISSVVDRKRSIHSSESSFSSRMYP